MTQLGNLLSSTNTEVSQIECHPRHPLIAASVSGNNVLVWNLQRPDAWTETLSNYKQITSISWRNTDEKVLATASQDNNLIIWDVPNCKQIAKVNQRETSASTNIVTWNQRDPNSFATAQDKTIKLWDMRKFEVGHELFQHEVSKLSNLRQICFDPVFGSLLLAQNKNQVLLYKADDMTQITEQNFKMPLVTSQFLPFLNYKSPGVIIQPERPERSSSNFVFLQVVEEGSRAKHYFSQYEPSESWNLRFNKMKADQAGPTSGNTMPQDISSYAIRRDPISNDIYQILSCSNDNSLKILTLNKQFVQQFYQREILCLSESLNRNDFEESKDQEQQPIAELAPINALEGEYTQLQRSKIEVENLRALSYVSGLTVEEIVKVSFDTERLVDSHENNIQLSVHLRLNVQNSFLSIYIVIPPDYPEKLPRFHVGESYMVRADLIRVLEKGLKQIPESKSNSTFTLHKQLESIYLILSRKNEDNSDKLMQSLIWETQEVMESSNQTREQKIEESLISSHVEQRQFIAYPRTCSFSWNCFNQIAYVANQKYNFDTINRKPELKKQFNWPEQRLQLTEVNSLHEDRFLFDDRHRNKFLEDDQGVEERSQHSDSPKNVTNIEFDNDDDNCSYYDEDEEGTQSEFSFENSSNGIDEQNSRRPLDYIRQSHDQTIADQRKKPKLQYIGTKEQKSPYSKIYKIHLKLSQWKEPSSMVARLQTLCQNQNCTEYCMESALRFAQNNLMQSAQVWQLLGVSLDLTIEKIQIWAEHPLGKGLALNAISYFESRKNFQQVAMVAALILAKEIQIAEQEDTKKLSKVASHMLRQQDLYGKSIHSDQQYSNSSPQDIVELQVSLQKNSPQREYQQPVHLKHVQSNPGLNSQKEQMTQSSRIRNNKHSYNNVTQKNQILNGVDYHFDEIPMKETLKSSKRDPASLESSAIIGSLGRQQPVGSNPYSQRQITPSPRKEDYLDNMSFDKDDSQYRISYELNAQRSFGDRGHSPKLNELQKSPLVKRTEKSSLTMMHCEIALSQQDSEYVTQKSVKVLDSLVSLAKKNEEKCYQANQSLIISQDPKFAVSFTLSQHFIEQYHMILYLKWYSDRLYQWQETVKAIQISKLASRAFSLLCDAQKLAKSDQISSVNLKDHHYMSRNLFGNPFPDSIIKRELNMQDLLLFSERSLNYQISWLEHCSADEIEKQMVKQKEYHLQDEMLKCSICHLTARGLVYSCPTCKHGGHYQHLKEWFTLNCDEQEGVRSLVYCPTGCGCTDCFK